MSNIDKNFENPTAEFRGKPFWSWNGQLNKDELIRQVGVLKEMGFGGYFMHSRTGLVTEYLGDEWFQLINDCADEGEKLGMESWLYDEDRWPSGTAGGMVTQNPKYSMRYLRMEIIEGSKYQFNDQHFIVFSCNLDNLNFNDEKIITKDTCNDEYKNKTVLAFSIEVQEPGSFYNGFTYVDTMCREATDKFIELTHEKYADKCGDRLGKNIKGIFTDEPHRGSVMCGFSVPNHDNLYLTPYTYSLFDDFKSKFGYDLKERLPDLYLIKNGCKISQVKWHYMELIEELFLNNFAKPINEWCNNHDIILTGHALHEDSFTTQACMIGSIMRFYEHMGYPGVDVLSEGNRAYWIVKQLTSAARQLGQKHLLSELYGCSGWQMDFESHKWTGDWQALFGINLRCPHLSWYTMEGEAKRDYPASIFHQSAWYKDYPIVEDYFSRLHVILNETPICDILVVNPVESTWAMIYPGWSHSLGTNHPDIAELENMYNKQFHWLATSQIDFDYGDEEMMSRYCNIIKAEDGTPLLQFGKMAYKIVVISGMAIIRKTTVDLLSKFINIGGKVILAGNAPEYVDATISDEFKKLIPKISCVPFEKATIVDEILKTSPRILSVCNAEGKDIPDIFCQIRTSDDGYFAVLMNMSKEKTYYNVNISIKLNGVVEEWSCRDGSKSLISKSDNGLITIVTDFEAAREHVYSIKATSDLLPSPQLNKILSYPLGEKYKIELSEPNILVLDLATFEIEGVKYTEPTEILKIDQKVRDTYNLPHRGGEMIQPWFADKKPQVNYGKIAINFDFFVQCMPEKVYLVVEAPEKWNITVNGNKVENDMRDGKWIDISFIKFAISANMLKKGKNIVSFEADFTEDMNLEAAYLLGDFGVTIDNSNKTIIEPITSIFSGCIVPQGLPFYSGSIIYKMNVDYSKISNERIIVSLGDFEAALVKVSANGKSPIAIAWQPYEADITDMLVDGHNTVSLEYVLTRRNTFGPLHHTVLRPGSYGPGNFTTDGEGWTNNYMLIPNGMTSIPEIIVKR